MRAAAVRLARAAIQRLSPPTRLALRRELEVVAPLDYSSPLYLECSSRHDLRRTGSCAKEPETVNWIETYVQRGDVFYDIGANVGAYSLIAALRGALVCAFEPSPNTYAQLIANFARNGLLSYLRPFCVGLGDRNGVSPIHLASPESGAAQHTWWLGGSALWLPVLGLDTAIDRFSVPWPNHIKIDVDGPEEEVVLGATRALRYRELSSILIEVSDDRSGAQAAKMARITERLRAAGFSLAREYPHGPKTLNCLFVRDTV
jgi:FkbM family methyltransferase